jgi:hypothetical protein
MSGRYVYCGCELDSTLDLAGLAAGTGRLPDVTIEVGAVPGALSDPIRSSIVYQLRHDEALWRLEGVAAYHIAEGGRRIVVAPAQGADPLAVRLFLLEPVFALAGLLRGEWMLAGSAVERDGRVAAFVGPSASGKSVAAALLARRSGFRAVADTLLRVTLDGKGRPVAWPQGPGLALWPDARKVLEIADTGCMPLREGLASRRWTAPLADGPLPLARIGLLREQRGDDLELFTPTPRIGRNAFETLLQQLAGAGWNEALGARPGLFAWGIAVAGTAPVEQLDLPWGWDQLDRLAERLAEWAGGGVAA